MKQRRWNNIRKVAQEREDFLREQAYKDRLIKEQQQVIADRDAVIADKDAKIERLKAKLKAKNG